MFIFLLIAAELAVLYAAFWYLYVRDPKCNHPIRGQLWGSYPEDYTTGSIDSTFTQDELECLLPDSSLQQSRWDFGGTDELMLDPLTNRYILVHRQHGSLFQKVAAEIDKRLSRLNVRP